MIYIELANCDFVQRYVFSMKNNVKNSVFLLFSFLKGKSPTSFLKEEFSIQTTGTPCGRAFPWLMCEKVLLY